MQINRPGSALILCILLCSLATTGLAQGKGGGGGGKPSKDEGPYSIIDLGTLGGEHSRAYDVNDWGEIAGNAKTDSGENFAVIWTVNTSGQVVSINALPKLVQGLACAGTAINNSGTVVGYCLTGVEGDLVHAVLWKNGVLTDLDVFYARSLTAYDINDDEQIVATTDDGNFLLDNGSVTVIGAPFSWVFGINAHGQVVGQSAEALLWTNGIVTNLGSLSGVYSFAEALNDEALNDPGQIQIVGGDGRPGTSLHPTMWTVDASGSVVQSITDLGTLGGNSGRATDINNAGQVVGATRTAKKNRESEHEFAFIWENGAILNLGTLKRPYAHSSWAEAINEDGFVVGSSYNIDHQSRAVLWIPN